MPAPSRSTKLGVSMALAQVEAAAGGAVSARSNSLPECVAAGGRASLQAPAPSRQQHHAAGFSRRASSAAPPLRRAGVRSAPAFVVPPPLMRDPTLAADVERFMVQTTPVLADCGVPMDAMCLVRAALQPLD
jgi:hypothetical protein